MSVSDPPPDTSGAERARLQPVSDHTAPQAHRSLDRLLGDSELLLRLQLSGYADAEWQPVSAEFARYGLSVMRAWIADGRIFLRVHAKQGFHLSRPDEPFDEDAVQTLATDTVVAALQAFLESVLKQNRWDSTKGASLKTYFIGQCVLQFANVYRKWRREHLRHLRSVPVGTPLDLDARTHPAPGPDHNLLLREGRDRALELLSTTKARAAFAMHTSGYSHEEVATELGLGDAKAVENLLGYQRRRASHTTHDYRRAE